jgi:hypothetical protein
VRYYDTLVEDMNKFRGLKNAAQIRKFQSTVGNLEFMIAGNHLEATEEILHFIW